MDGFVWDDMPNGLAHFIVLTVVLGGAAAIASGRAVAGSWRSFAIVPFYMIVLSAVIRFLQYALFQGDLLSLPQYGVTFVLMLLAGAWGYRSRRAEQMATQYSWLFSKAGPLGWSPRPLAK